MISVTCNQKYLKQTPFINTWGESLTCGSQKDMRMSLPSGPVNVYPVQLGSKKTIQLENGRELRGRFSKEDIQMVSRHMKRCSASANIREMHIQTQRVTPSYVLQGLSPKDRREQGLMGMWRKGSPGTLIVGV